MPHFDISALRITRPQRHALSSLPDHIADYAQIVTRSLSEGASLTERSSSEKTCGANGDAKCTKPTNTGDSGKLTIILGAVVPITCAIVILFFLHRRLVRKRRAEDAADRLHSLDFGTGPVNLPNSRSGGPGGKRFPEMAVSDLGDDFQLNGTRRPKGLSMDMASNPYLLPAEIQSSRESVHSMSRSVHDRHDPYRPVTMMMGDAGSMRSYPRSKPGFETASTFSASTGLGSTNENAKLMSNAQRMSRSYSKRTDSSSPPSVSRTSVDLPALPTSAYQSQPPSRKPSIPELNIPMRGPEPSSPIKEDHPLPPIPPQKAVAPPPRTSSAADPPRPLNRYSPPALTLASQTPDNLRESSNYDDNASMMRTSTAGPEGQEPTYDIDPAEMYADMYADDAADPQYDDGYFHQPQPQNNRVSIVGVRPLPPDHAEDNPEQRANRIRSFYKEYFDTSKPAQETYEEDYDPSFLSDGAIYDPETGTFVTPWNHNVGRRAMTPPPRAAPRSSSGRSGAPTPHRRTLSTSMRGRLPTQQQKKQLPPPKPLVGLGTPHLLRDDSAIFNAADFAPPTSFRERQIGRRADSPLGGARPYSPSVRAHTPVISSFAELRPMPSPHELRKSSTFTALDFAPPKFSGRHGSVTGGSDAGSIRSNRSGISAVQNQAIRDGAYRVSRIPKEMVTTRDDLAHQLRPTWNMRDQTLAF